MGDLKSPRVIIFKGLMFLLLGLVSSALLIGLTRDVQVAILLLIAIWAFCRFYYFAFYVIEKYVDSEFRFDGLYAVMLYLLRNRSGD